MILVMTTTAAFFLMALVAVFMVLQKIRTDETVPVDLISQDSPLARYRPMFRLLDESDCGFISAGFPKNSSMLRRFRAERRSLFRIYLRNLGHDHGRIVGAIRTILVESQLDRPELAKALYRCQFMFGLAVISVEFKLLLHSMGIGTVDVRSMVSAVEGLQLQLQDMMFVQAVG